jgi:hypothetical protein
MEGLKGRIMDYLKENKGSWFPSYNIELKSRSWGYSASSGTRSARHLAEKGKIRRKHISQVTKHDAKLYKVKIAYYHA